MKILAIRGKNLASLEGEFDIDFGVEPLKSAGIYAITGPTGAGKSTILDALCLALFDDAPRTNKAVENIKISDVLDKTISQKDCRNILRKGAGEGRAEVDFIALNGEIYRSVWSVKRMKNKPGGTLQATEIRLCNLVTNIEEQGNKKVLLKKITELVGLTFEQFIRAVLLAQGDFATFLKAKQSDKAELLEKLTGTDIYSKISATIFRKTKEAAETLGLMQQRIKDVVLLNDEDIAELQQEKSRIEKELEPVKDILSTIDKKLNWIKQHEELSKETSEAETGLKKIQRTIEEAKPRYDYVVMLDDSLEIRDTYIDLEDKRERFEKLNLNLSSHNLQLKQCEEQISDFDGELLKIKVSMEQTEQDFTAVKPQIAKSKELDVKILPAKEKLSAAEHELKLQNVQKSKSGTNISTISGNLSEAKKQSETIANWFKEKESLKDVVQQTDLIVATLDDMQFTEKQIVQASENLKTNNALLISQNETLERLKNEAERLNNLLPTEILNLRAKLTAGEPCPVCGSIHHPVKTEIIQSAKVNEKELEKKKKETTDFIADITKKTESVKESITQLDTIIKGYKAQYQNATGKIEKPLLAVANWQNFIPGGALKSRLLKFAAQWKENEEKQNNCLKQIELFTEKLSAENNLLATVSAECVRKEALYNEAALALKTLENERAGLLDGKKAVEVESFYITGIERQSKKYENLKTSKTKVETTKSEITGIISKVQEDIKTVATQIAGLKTVTDEWLANNKHQINQDMLKNLVAKSHSWIADEKKELAGLEEKKIRLETTYKERNARMEKHNESENKPDDKETKELLNQLFKDTTVGEKELRRRQTHIDVSFAKDKDNKELVASLDIELKMKTEICEEWKKLCDFLGSADGHKFKNIAQSYTMDVLLDYANKHLETLSKRYKLEKTDETLALQVVDNDMLGEVRTVHSLSGGESFLISLSLALGLSALSSNRMKIESLFIDEGFGSLDADTLGIAIDALENLYTQGRQIGIISHIGEMRIPTQIQVTKSANGKSEIKISSAMSRIFSF